MNLILDELLELIEVPVIPEVRSAGQVRIYPKRDLDYDHEKRFWRLFGKYPNDFAAAVNKLLPDSVKFVSYDHLNNVLTYEQP